MLKTLTGLAAAGMLMVRGARGASAGTGSAVFRGSRLARYSASGSSRRARGRAGTSGAATGALGRRLVRSLLRGRRLGRRRRCRCRRTLELVVARAAVDRRALADPSEIPLGWNFSPSSYVQRVPIVTLAFVGYFVSRYLTTYQLGHVPHVWDPLFAGTSPDRNGTESVITSALSRAS